MDPENSVRKILGSLNWINFQDLWANDRVDKVHLKLLQFCYAFRCRKSFVFRFTYFLCFTVIHESVCDKDVDPKLRRFFDESYCHSYISKDNFVDYFYLFLFSARLTKHGTPSSCLAFSSAYFIQPIPHKLHFAVPKNLGLGVIVPTIDKL